MVTQTTTTTGRQDLTDTYTAVTGSLVSSYTPTTGASSVYYSVNLQINNGDSRGICNFIPYLDGTQQGQKKGFSLDLNIVSWSFLGLGLILSSSSIHYVKLVISM